MYFLKVKTISVKGSLSLKDLIMSLIEAVFYQGYLDEEYKDKIQRKQIR